MQIKSIALIAILLAAAGARAQQQDACAVPAYTPPPAAADCPECFAKRWVYFAGDLSGSDRWCNGTFKSLINLMPVLRQNGYNAIALHSTGGGGYYKLLQSSPPGYLEANLRKIVEIAADYGLEVIPVGATPDVPALLDPSLAEALPVTDTPFTVTSLGIAKPFGAQVIASTFDSSAGGWDKDDVTVSFDASQNNSASSGGAMRLTPNKDSNTRLMRTFTGLQPHKAYRISYYVKTQNYTGSFAVQVNHLNKDPSSVLYYNYSSPMGWGTKADGNWNDDKYSLSPNQGWTRYEADFNTADSSGFSLFLGTWTRGDVGTAWVDDVEIREIGLAHRVDRSTLPVVVRKADGSAVTDSVAGNGQLRVPDSLPVGTSLLVSWYQSGANMSTRWGTPATACLPAYFDWQAALYDKLATIFTSQRYFIYHDEIRVMNWDPSCNTAGDAATYFANLTSTLQDRLHAANGNLEMLTWNDMYDEYVNAKPNYFLVNGSLVGAASGLRPGTRIVNWADPGVLPQSYAFFTQRGLPQMIALYYDNIDRLGPWLTATQQAETSTGVAPEGVMYTTWKGDYSKLQAVAEAIKQKWPTRWP